MAILNKSTLASLFTSFKTVFNGALGTAQPVYTEVTTVYSSDSKRQEYPFMGFIPLVREWIGERIVQSIKAYNWIVENKKWETTVEVLADDIEDDNIGVYSPLVQSMGHEMAMHPDRLCAELLLAGISQVCYDGQFYFDTDHPAGEGETHSNDHALALSAANYATVRTAMMTTPDDRGEQRLRITPNLLVVPPSLEFAARTILEKEFDAAGGNNIYYQTAKILVWPELESAPTRWYLMDTTKAVKPLIFQMRRNPRLISKTNPQESDGVFMNDKFKYGGDYRGVAAYGLWQVAATSIAP